MGNLPCQSIRLIFSVLPKVRVFLLTQNSSSWTYPYRNLYDDYSFSSFVIPVKEVTMAISASFQSLLAALRMTVSVSLAYAALIQRVISLQTADGLLQKSMLTCWLQGESDLPSLNSSNSISDRGYIRKCCPNKGCFIYWTTCWQLC